MKMKVTVIGLGYVGLPLLCAIAKSKKYIAVGFDLDKKKVEQIKKKICPIDDETCTTDLKKVELEVSMDEKILAGSDIFIICVPTPVYDNFKPNYGPVIGASKVIAKYLRDGNIIILESTVNPGTCEEVVMPVLSKISKVAKEGKYTLAHCPERINPGDPRWTVYNIPRNVGTFPESDVKKVADFYRNFIDTDINEVSGLKVAEATKIVENTFRDIDIAYVNELAMSFDAMGIDLVDTLKGASNKPFAFMAHWPGRGVGGHCIAVDPYYLINRAAKSGFNHSFLKIARNVNNGMPAYTVKRLEQGFKEAKLNKKTKIALLGLSYKENIGDLRESPCLKIVEILKKKKYKLNVFDPFVVELSSVKSLKEAMSGVEAVIVCTAHNEFVNIHEILKNNKRVKVVVDGMNKLDKNAIKKLNIIYKGIGR